MESIPIPLCLYSNLPMVHVHSHINIEIHIPLKILKNRLFAVQASKILDKFSYKL